MKENPTTTFLFRALLSVDPGDDTLEIFIPDLEIMASAHDRTAREWAEEAMGVEDLRRAFNLEEGKYYQVYGKATLEGWWDYWGEYDERIDYAECRHREETPESFAALGGCLMGEEEKE